MPDNIYLTMADFPCWEGNKDTAFCSMCGPKFCSMNIDQHTMKEKVHELKVELKKEGKLTAEMVVPQ